jgi:4-hydroxy-tetrahydrodipicolinate synthase
MGKLSGVWVPLITPFKDGAFDGLSYRTLIDHYIDRGVAGLIPLGTTGEAPALEDIEIEAIVDKTISTVAGRRPIFVGIGGNATRKVVEQIRRLQAYEFEGILSVCPYYNRPTQDGLLEHFRAISDATDRQILVYNIPYRTGVNLRNDTLLRLAQLPNIVGVKDSSGSITQSLDLLASRPEDFSVLTGEDSLFFSMLANGADGGILASCHIATERFVRIFALMAANDHRAALAQWQPLASLVSRLFVEANPMPIKHCLWRAGLIASPECRLPLGRVSVTLARELDAHLSHFAKTCNRSAESDHPPATNKSG